MFSAASAPPKLFTLVLLSGLSVVSLNMFLPSLSNIAAEFQTNYRLLASVGCLGGFALSHDAGRDRLWVRAFARDHSGY